MNHSEHYPTMIEHPRTKQRVQVNTPLAHHRQLLTWKLPGLEPIPENPAEVQEIRPRDPGYPRMIENEKTGERVQVESIADHDMKLAFWASKGPAKLTTPRPAAPPPPKAPPAKPAAGTAKASASNKGKGASKGEPPQPPTKEDLMKQNYPASIAQRMADEEVRKFNAGEPPYDGK